MTTAMTNEQFRHAAKLGLGRAVTAVRADPMRYRDTLTEVLSEKRMYRSDCTYDIELLSCLPEPEKAVRRIYETVLPELKEGNGNWRIPLLIAFGFWEELYPILEQQYDIHYRNLRDFLQSGIRDDDEAYACAQRYWCSVFQLTHYRRAETERIRRMLEDLAELYDYTGDSLIPEYLQASRVSYDLEKEEFDALLAEAAACHRNGKKCWKAMPPKKKTGRSLRSGSPI